MLHQQLLLTRPVAAAVAVHATVPVLQSRCSFVCAPPLLRGAVTEAETVTGRAMELADAAQEVFLAQPLLTSVAVHADSTSAGIAGLEVGAVLMLTLVEPDQRVKVQVALRLSNMLAHAHPGEPTEHYNTVRWYSKVQYMCVAHNPELFISCVALSNSAARNALRPLLPCNFAVHSPRTLGKLMMTSQSQGLRHCDNASTIISCRLCCFVHQSVLLPVRCPAGTRMRAVAGAVAVMVAPKDAEVALEARLQEAIGSAVAGPYKLADGSTGTSQVALLTAVCEAAVRVMKG